MDRRVRHLRVGDVNTFEYLRDAFGARAANVLLNTEILLFAPIAAGVWDAAFAETGHGPTGFDFEGSPFGEDAFDMFPFNPAVKGRLKYRDVFTGFAYANSLESQYLQHGVPGYFQGFEEEALRRAELVSEDYRRTIELLIQCENSGQVALRKEMPRHRIESLLELSLLALAGVGLLIGAALSLMSSRGAKSPDSPSGSLTET